MAARLGLICTAVALALLIGSALPWPGIAANGDSDGTRVYSAEDVAYGQALFSAKGCATCHQHAAVAGSGKFASGGPGSPPALTTYAATPATLRAWLRDPQTSKPTTQMPNLGLSDPEIEALMAFLASGR